LSKKSKAKEKRESPKKNNETAVSWMDGWLDEITFITSLRAILSSSLFTCSRLGLAWFGFALLCD